MVSPNGLTSWIINTGDQTHLVGKEDEKGGPMVRRRCGFLIGWSTNDQAGRRSSKCDPAVTDQLNLFNINDLVPQCSS
jgi:hypothetical protein